ncbi:MAG: hypothetical protein BWY31_04551 [Lentisphaerae bacterium ADurb.Bin242]|nr:MAG: hypothetical protein BWY31_04551 [Lentisphaerae bacterium ADurb.Bin242]
MRTSRFQKELRQTKAPDRFAAEEVEQLFRKFQLKHGVNNRRGRCAVSHDQLDPRELFAVHPRKGRPDLKQLLCRPVLVLRQSQRRPSVELRRNRPPVAFVEDQGAFTGGICRDRRPDPLLIEFQFFGKGNFFRHDIMIPRNLCQGKFPRRKRPFIRIEKTGGKAPDSGLLQHPAPDLRIGGSVVVHAEPPCGIRGIESRSPGIAPEIGKCGAVQHKRPAGSLPQFQRKIIISFGGNAQVQFLPNLFAVFQSQFKTLFPDAFPVDPGNRGFQEIFSGIGSLDPNRCPPRLRIRKNKPRHTLLQLHFGGRDLQNRPEYQRAAFPFRGFTAEIPEDSGFAPGTEQFEVQIGTPEGTEFSLAEKDVVLNLSDGQGHFIKAKVQFPAVHSDFPDAPVRSLRKIQLRIRHGVPDAPETVTGKAGSQDG